MNSAAGQRSRLLGIKLRALVTEHLGEPIGPTVGEFPSGASLVADGQAWILIDVDADRALGPSLAWTVRHGATALHIVAESHTALLARRAQRFRLPISVWYPVERTMLAAVAEPIDAPPAAPAAHLELTALIEAAGATALVEYGVVNGEVRGLEVCRVVDTPTTGYFDEPDGGPPISSIAGNPDHGGGVIVEVGVGAPDREAFRIIHGDVPTVEALANVVATVEAHRGLGAPPHPLNRLAPERFLRWRLQQDPKRAGMTQVTPIDPPVPRRGLNDIAPCVARATTVDGGEVSLVCSVGVDLDLVGFIADVQALHDRPVVVALPSRDLLPITTQLANLLLVPPQFVTVD